MIETTTGPSIAVRAGMRIWRAFAALLIGQLGSLVDSLVGARGARTGPKAPPG